MSQGTPIGMNATKGPSFNANEARHRQRSMRKGGLEPAEAQAAVMEIKCQCCRVLGWFA